MFRIKQDLGRFGRVGGHQPRRLLHRAGAHRAPARAAREPENTRDSRASPSLPPAPSAWMAGSSNAGRRRRARARDDVFRGRAHIRHRVGSNEPFRQCRRVRPAARDAAGLDRDGEALRPLRPRRGADAPPDRRTTSPASSTSSRVGVWLLVAAALGDRARPPGPVEGGRLLGARDRARHDRTVARARLVSPAQHDVPPEHDHRRRRRRRPAGRAQAPPAPGVRHQPRRLRRRRAAEPRRTISTTSTLLGARRRRCPSSSGMLDVERVIVAFSSESHRGDARSSSRSLNDARRPDRHRAATLRARRPERRRSTRSRACRSSALPPRAAVARPRGSLKRAIDIVGAPIAARRDRAAVRLHRAGGSSATRRARSSSGRRGSAMNMQRVHGAEVPHDARRHRHDRAPRVHRADDGPAAPRRRRTASTSSSRDDAITPFGRWLRRTSLDELPQLINVLRGDMSLVGPRPCIPYETEHFQPHHFDRFLVPAGITGLWQVDRPGALDVRRGARHGRRLRPRLVARARPPAALPHAVRAARTQATA